MGRALCTGMVLVCACKEPAQVPATPAPAPAVPAATRILRAPESGPVATAVLRESERAAKAGDRLLVYVGATWCEPCRRFHEAFESGSLDADLPHLRLLEFDLDKDGERLGAAGYASEYIPLFAVPGPDGRASGRMAQGAIKGDGAVPFLVPKLKDLLK